MKRAFLFFGLAVTVATFAGTAFADRNFPGGNCRPWDIGVNREPTNPLGFLGNRVATLGLLHSKAPSGGDLGDTNIICPVSLEETGDVSAVNFEVYGFKTSDGIFSCFGYVGFRFGSIIASPSRHLCSAVAGCSSPEAGFSGNGALLLTVPISPATDPFHGGVYCNLVSASDDPFSFSIIYSYGQTGGTPGSPLR